MQPTIQLECLPCSRDHEVEVDQRRCRRQQLRLVPSKSTMVVGYRLRQPYFRLHLKQVKLLSSSWLESRFVCMAELFGTVLRNFMYKIHRALVQLLEQAGKPRLYSCWVNNLVPASSPVLSATVMLTLL